MSYVVGAMGNGCYQHYAPDVSGFRGEDEVTDSYRVGGKTAVDDGGGCDSEVGGYWEGEVLKIMD